MKTSKAKNGRSKTHLKFVKMKKFFTTFCLKQPNSEESIFIVYKYSRRLLTRILSPKFFK